MSVWFKSRLNPWYIWIPSNPNLYSTKIIMKMRWQTIASNVSIRTISPTATPLPKAYDCVAVYIAGRRTSLVVYGWWPQPPTKNRAHVLNKSQPMSKHVTFLNQTHFIRSYNKMSYLILKVPLNLINIILLQYVQENKHIVITYSWISFKITESKRLTQCGLVMPYSNLYLN